MDIKKNKISYLIGRMLPAHIIEDYPQYTAFIQGYFEYLEREFGEYDMIQNLLGYGDIDNSNLVPQYLNEYRKTYAGIFPGNFAADTRLLVKNIRDFYKSKGTEQSFRFLFRALFDKEIEFYYPKNDLFKTSVDSAPSSQKKLQDSLYYQDFSYEIRTDLSIVEYRELIKKILHPAGMAMFGKLVALEGTFYNMPDVNSLTLWTISTLHNMIIPIDVNVFHNNQSISTTYTRFTYGFFEANRENANLLAAYVVGDIDFLTGDDFIIKTNDTFDIQPATRII